jgi:hypothetical protein
MATGTARPQRVGPPTDGDGRTDPTTTRVGAPRWTTAHTEAARFLGRCVGAGAVLGMVAAMSRTPRGERRAR